MNYLLDTNICIYIIKKRPAAVFRKFKELAIGEVAISSITYSELAYGVEKSRHREQNTTALQQFIAPLEVLAYPESAAGDYGEIRSHLERIGRPIDPLDTLIAAHARHVGHTLVTNNLKEFARVPRWRTENWGESLSRAESISVAL